MLYDMIIIHEYEFSDIAETSDTCHKKITKLEWIKIHTALQQGISYSFIYFYNRFRDDAKEIPVFTRVVIKCTNMHSFQETPLSELLCVNWVS